MNIKVLILSVFLAFTMTACESVDRLMGNLSPNARAPESHLVREPTSNALINDCPQVKIVNELGMLAEFSNPALPDEKTLISKAAISLGESGCTYTERSVTMDIRLMFESQLGPRGKMKETDTPFVSYPFFVAITNGEGRILAKEVFAASMTYSPGETTHTYFEGLRQVIPLSNREEAREHKVLIGFQLTSDQLAFNRRILAMQSPVGSPAYGQPILQKRTPITPGAPLNIMGSGY